mmetsp:Transcript_754/g.1592  ORF Transcript_754/g.1592 Transcript_754/m.1592 type:complete len:117 (-) Transcript_754:363-713(-)
MTFSTSKPMKTIILTKKHDGGSANPKRKLLRSSEKHFDAFSFYSSQEVRMNKLLGRHQENSPPNIENQETGHQVPTSNETQATLDRKTRLSFELHPSLVMMEILDSMKEQELNYSS